MLVSLEGGFPEEEESRGIPELMTMGRASCVAKHTAGELQLTLLLLTQVVYLHDKPPCALASSLPFSP